MALGRSTRLLLWTVGGQIRQKEGLPTEQPEGGPPFCPHLHPVAAGSRMSLSPCCRTLC